MEPSPLDPPEGSKTAEEPPIPPSRPLVALQPAQKRQAKDPDLLPKRTSTVFKSPRTNEVVKPVARHAYNPWLADPTPGMRARHSAPGVEKNPASVELRGSKSAPDLRAPILAAIRGLQDGSIQVDQQTRAKIAHAARRVLEAREFRRRTSQEAYQSQGATAQTTEARQPAGIAQRDTGRQTVGNNDGQTTQAPATMGTLKSSTQGNASLDLPRAEFRKIAAEEQDEGLPSRFGETRAGRTSPFTVTTGVPKYSQGMVTEGLQTPNSPSALKQARTRSSPIPVMPMTSPVSQASLPRSLDFVSELGHAVTQLGQSADKGKAS